VRTIKDQAAVEATRAEQVAATVIGAVIAEVACGFPRRDSRLPARQMTQTMLVELERRNCWTLAGALGRPAPHRLQHFLSLDRGITKRPATHWLTGLRVN
jgi:hypothetical protein